MQHVSTFSPRFTARSRQKYLQHLQLTASSPKVSLHLRGRRPHFHFHSFYTNTLLHQPFLAETTFRTNQFLHKRTSFTNSLLHTAPFTLTRTYTDQLLHKPASTQSWLYSNLLHQLLHQPALAFLCPDQVQPIMWRGRERERREKTAIVLKPIYIYVYIYMSSGQNYMLNLMPCAN